MKKSRIIALLLSLIMLAFALITLIVPAVAAGEVNEYSGFYEKSERDEDTYAYSIAVIGDTQSLSLVDYQNRNDTSYVKRMDTLYSWIQNNIESKKIGLVMGLGDIIENWHNPLDYPEYKDTELGNQSIWEWENATRIFNTYLEDENGVKVPYTLVRGNHDSANAYNVFIASEDMAAYRGQFNSKNAGFYVDSNGVTKYDNSYMKLTLGTTKWLVLTLDFGITERELDWAGEVISNNPDYKVILSMHSYLYHDRTIDGEGDTQVTAVPNPNWDSSTDMRADNKTKENPEGPVYNPDGIWERLVSRHSNIELVLSGHIPNGAPQMSQLVGDNGNTVTQILIDPQSMDLPAANSSGCGMVAMLYFNEDGTLAGSQWDEKTVDIEWYSTIKKKHYKEDNQFTINLELYAGGSKTENYGVIPAEYLDAEKYPFVTFGYDRDIDEYFFLGAYSTWFGSSDGAYPSLSAISGGAKKVPAYILLRDNYTIGENETKYSMGKLVLMEVNLDLNGYTLTAGRNTSSGQDIPLIQANLGTAGNNSTVNVFGKAGSKLLSGSMYAALVNLGTSANGDGASFTVNFRDIYIGFSADAYDGVSTTKLLVQTSTMQSNDGKPAKTEQYINITNCTLDLATNREGKSVSLFLLNETQSDDNNTQIAHVSIAGGKIIVDDITKTTICTKNANDSFTYVALNDSYTQIVDGSSNSYTTTEYGSINETSYPTSTYPFVVFKPDGSYTAYTSWRLAAEAALKLDGDATVYMRRDYEIAENTHARMSDALGNTVIDLGGHNLISSGAYALQSYFANTADNRAFSITVKNGYMSNSYKNGMILFNVDGSKQTKKINISITLENITFSSTAGSYIFNAFSANNNTNDNGLDINATFNGCTINYDGNAVPFKLISGNGAKEDFNLELNGCSIVSTRAANVIKGDLFTYDEDDVISFGTYGGKATTFTSQSKERSITEVVETKNNTVTVFAYTSGNTLFTAKTVAREAQTIENYGSISDIYPKALFPFAVYKNGRMTPYISYFQAVSSDEAKGGTILLRRDYSTDECQNASQAPYNLGTCVVDLLGNTFTRGTNHIIQAYGKSTSGTATETTMTVKNGVFLVKNNAVVIFNNAGNVGNNAIFNITFDSVTFALAKGANATNLIINNFTGGRYGSIASVVLNNCTVDLTKNDTLGSIAPTGKITLFNLDGDDGKNFTAVTVKGGSIKCADTAKLELFKLGASGEDKAGNPRSDSFAFEKGNSGYTTLVANAGSAPTAEFNGLVFAKSSENAGVTTYVLVDKSIADFKPKSSITLDANLIFNVYIPENAYLTEITLDGTAYRIADLEALDGKYHFTVELPSAEAGRDVALTVTFGDEGSASYTLSTLKYAEKLLADGNATATTKTLVCNMLAYVKSAYTYFGTEGAEEIASAIDAIIGTGATEFEKIDDINGSMAVGAGVNGVTFILDAEPRVRFYLEAGTDLTNYAFKIDGVAQKFTATSETIGETNFVCADISLFAYKMIGTVEVYNGSTKLGSFHINDYYDFALTQNNSALVDVVERFYMYCKSAKAYRDEVIAGQ
ncbi:MAG: metallophosphoesterase [Clostridia bacterium]|nr:metallophosphoesterase [Clostridia bacterium]